jgi:endonuclease/exonuclease/phosphatase family metal-dependent hydrolase
LAVIRYANWAVLQEKSSGFIFVFTNTHFDNDTDNKEKSSALFYEKIAKLSSHYPLIVVGDFNTRASAPRYQRLIGGDENPPRLLNSYDLRPAGISAAMQHPNDLIDHILAGGPCMVTTRHWQVDTRTLENGNTLSDHNPLIAELQFAGFKP